MLCSCHQYRIILAPTLLECKRKRFGEVLQRKVGVNWVNWIYWLTGARGPASRIFLGWRGLPGEDRAGRLQAPTSNIQRRSKRQDLERTSAVTAGIFRISSIPRELLREDPIARRPHMYRRGARNG